MSDARQERGHQEDLASDFTNEVRWRQFLNGVRGWWPELTDNDLSALSERAFANDNHDGLIGRLRERYGLTHSQAWEQVNLFLQRFRRPKDDRRASNASD